MTNDQTERLDQTVPSDTDQQPNTPSSTFMEFEIVLRAATLPTWVATVPDRREAFHRELCQRLKDALTTTFANWGGTIDCNVY